LSEFSQEQLNWKPENGKDEDAWSLGEVFMHLAIDEIYLREMNGLEWFEGYAGHEAFHHQQIEALIGQLG